MKQHTSRLHCQS